MDKSTFHRDGTITHWSVYSQLWVRQSLESLSNAELASFSSEERAKILKRLAK